MTGNGEYWRHPIYLLICLLWLSGCSNPIPASFDQDTSPSGITYLFDGTDSLSFDDVRTQLPGFKAAPNNPPEFPWSSAPYWFHLTLTRDQHPENILLVIDTEMLGLIELHQPGKPVQKAGNLTEPNDKLVSYRKNLFQVSFGTQQSIELYFKVYAHTKVRFPLQILTEKTFFEAATINHLGLGLFFGAALIMAGYNLFLAFVLRKPAYFFYVLYTISIVLLAAFDARLLWQAGVPMRESVAVAIYSLTLLALILFIRSFLDVSRFSRGFSHALLAQAGITAAVVFFALFIDIKGFLGIFLVQVNLVLATVAWVAATFLALKNGYRPARYMLMAMAPTIFLFICIEPILFGVMQDFSWRLPSFRIAILIELLIFSLGLADMYRELERQREHEKITWFEEKEQLMRGVHDTVASDIHAALLSLPPTTENSLKTRLEHALISARDLASLIHSTRQAEQTLKQSVDEYVHTLRVTRKYEVNYHFDDKLNRLPMVVRLHIYRIFQEWMVNALRHGQAERFNIEFVRRERHIVMRVQTDGIPFSWNNLAPSTAIGSGLNNIQYRCGKIFARARAIPHRHGGSCFVLRTPA
jgi:signal transduction histidine kinase